jgi:hypothetical protein
MLAAMQASIYNSKEGWAREIVDDFNAQYFQRMEHQLMKQSDTRVASDSGFHAAISTMARHHDASVDKMEVPSRTSFESKRDALKEISGVSEVDQDIQTNKETIKDGENDIQLNAKTGLKNQKESLEGSRKEISQDFKENNDERITTKARRAVNPFKDLGKTTNSKNKKD